MGNILRKELKNGKKYLKFMRIRDGFFLVFMFYGWYIIE